MVEKGEATRHRKSEIGLKLILKKENESHCEKARKSRFRQKEEERAAHGRELKENNRE